MSKLVLELSDAEFEREVIKSPVPVLVDFWASWCGPCKSIAPVIEQLAQEFEGKLKVCKVNVDQNRESTTRYHVRGIPTLILFKNGERQDQIVGVHTKEDLISAIKKVIG